MQYSKILHVTLSKIRRSRSLLSSNPMMGINLPCSNPFQFKSINVIVVLGVAATIMILLSSSYSFYSSSPFIQYASALKPVVQITSAKSGGSDIPNGGTAMVPQGQTTAKLTFEFRGFDDNDRIVGFLCSWDGINYQRSNCSSESAESRSTFVGPDGVARAYYLKTGTASRDLAPRPTTLSYTFGVKVVNDNNDISPAATWTFKVKPAQGSPETEATLLLPETYKVTVRFTSISVSDDHDWGPKGAGEFHNYAYVQGKLVDLRMDVDAPDTIDFKADKQVTVYLLKEIPLSIFTVGYEDDDCVLGFHIFPSPAEDITKDLPIFNNNELDWWHAIEDYQSKEAKMWTSGSCPADALGTMKAFHNPPGYDAGPHHVKSSKGDFALRYTIFVEGPKQQW